MQANSSALIIALLVAMLGGAAGYLEAWLQNPARDFGPRLFCYLMSSGWAARPGPLNYWSTPIAGSLYGGVAVQNMYQWLVRAFLRSRRATAASGLVDPSRDALG